MAAIKKHRTTILIDCDRDPHDDLQFIVQRGLKPTNLLRSKIKELKERELGLGINFEVVNKKLHTRLDRLCKALEDTLSKEDFDKIMSSI